jgi:hypothetical protein
MFFLKKSFIVKSIMQLSSIRKKKKKGTPLNPQTHDKGPYSQTRLLTSQGLIT